MRIQLQQSEIEDALLDYIQSQGINLTNKVVDITFTQTRNPTMINADLDINPFGTNNTLVNRTDEDAPETRVRETDMDQSEDLPEIHAAEDEVPFAVDSTAKVVGVSDEAVEADEPGKKKASLFG